MTRSAMHVGAAHTPEMLGASGPLSFLMASTLDNWINSTQSGSFSLDTVQMCPNVRSDNDLRFAPLCCCGLGESRGQLAFGGYRFAPWGAPVEPTAMRETTMSTEPRFC